MGNFINKIVGDLNEKKEWKQIEARAKALPSDYAVAYEEIKKYIWNTAGTETIAPFKTLVDMFEEAAANGKSVAEITGTNVAAFVDDLVRGEKSYFDKKRAQLNRNISKKLKK